MFHLHILTDAQIAALKNAGHEVEHFAISEAQKAVLALKTKTDIGSKIADAIKTVESQQLSGPQKFEQVLVNDVLPEVLKYATGGGFSAVISDVESIGRELLQSVFNDVQSTTAGKIGAEILHVAGL